jgi:hypothetical protein
MNDREREQWILNHEGLYNWWKSTKLGMKRFLLAHRAEVDNEIKKIIDQHAEKATADRCSKCNRPKNSMGGNYCPQCGD